MKKALLFLAALGLLLMVVGCGGGSSKGGGNQTPVITSVVVSPETVTLASGGTQQFTATVNGTGNYDPTVIWSASAGAITTTGLYTAPVVRPRGQALAVTVTATANGDRNKLANTAVTVNPPVITTATLVWDNIQTVGGGLSAARAIAVFNGKLVVVGFGNLDEATQTESDMALSYTFDGAVGNKYVGPAESTALSVGLLGTIASGDVVLAGGSSLTGQGALSVFDQNINLTTTDACPSIEYAGTFVGFAKNGVTVYFGIDRKPNAGPAIATSDVNGNLNCAAAPIDLPIDASGRIGSVVATDNFLVATGDLSTNTGTTNVAGWLAKLGLDGKVQGQKQFNNIILPSAVVVQESGSSFIYLVGTLFGTPTAPGTQLFWTDKLDANLNELPGWPKTWDGDNASFVGTGGGGLANWGNAIVANPASTGGVIAIGQITEPPPNADPNRGDCGMIAYGPDGAVLWKTRQDFSGGDTCNAAVVDAASMSLFVAGATNEFTGVQQTLTAEFALPGVPAPAAKSRALAGDLQAEEPARGDSEPTTSVQQRTNTR